jgi:hypothetical protein
MKQLKHIFNRLLLYNNFVAYGDVCVFCGKTGETMYNNILDINVRNLISNSIRSFISDCELFDKYSPCLTEEEYLIKSIIE